MTLNDAEFATHFGEDLNRFVNIRLAVGGPTSGCGCAPARAAPGEGEADDIDALSSMRAAMACASAASPSITE